MIRVDLNDRQITNVVKTNVDGRLEGIDTLTNGLLALANDVEILRRALAGLGTRVRELEAQCGCISEMQASLNVLLGEGTDAERGDP